MDERHRGDILPSFSVTDFVAMVNQILEYSLPLIRVVGEVGGFKINQDKFVFFDLKEGELSLSCFMMKFKLRTAIKDGDKIAVVARPNLTRFGKFSLTVEQIMPIGDGVLKKRRDELHHKLLKEGLFAAERKRPLPALPERIAVISSVEAAGYKDFIKILSERWRGMNIVVKNTTVQGDSAPAEIISAIDFFNGLGSEQKPEMIAIVRGGGSKDDLKCFDDEQLVRAVATSQIPIVSGIGHDIDTSLVDLAADLMAATPSHLAQLLVPSYSDFCQGLDAQMELLCERLRQSLAKVDAALNERLRIIEHLLELQFTNLEQKLAESQKILRAFDPKQALRRGYAIVRGEVRVGGMLEIETEKQIIKTKVKEFYDKNN